MFQAFFACYDKRQSMVHWIGASDRQEMNLAVLSLFVQ
jgi:hypothetical protein